MTKAPLAIKRRGKGGIEAATVDGTNRKTQPAQFVTMGPEEDSQIDNCWDDDCDRTDGGFDQQEQKDIFLS